MADQDDRTDQTPEAAEPAAASEASGPTPAGSVPDVPPEQRGAADTGGTPGAEPGGERSGGAGAATGGVLESPGGPATVGEDEHEQTLAGELVEESHEGVGEVSPEMGETKADPGAGGTRFDELMAKRKGAGLSDEESEELGRLLAQREGREWTSTRTLRTHPPDATS
ncbi:MAG TPA: hypothetical protein VID47_04095 [Actinomycetota bacterium]|jgi:hypothetical protein